MNETKKRRYGVLLLDGLLLLGGILAKFLASAMIRWLPDCIFASMGITCPACGATRCVREFFSGNFSVAFGLHPFIFCLIWYLAAALVVLNIGFVLGQKHCQSIAKILLGYKAIIALAIVYAVFGLIRMFLYL